MVVRIATNVSFLCFIFSSQASALFAHDVVPCLVVVYHLVNLSPIGQTADVTVINPHVYFQLAGEVIVPFLSFFGIVFVDGVKLNATLAAPVDGFVEKRTFADSPQYQFVMLFDKHLQRLCGKRKFFANLRILVGDYRSIKIYGYCHSLLYLFIYIRA